LLSILSAPGIFPKDFSKRIARLFRERQIGDYEFDISISADAAKRRRSTRNGYRSSNSHLFQKFSIRKSMACFCGGLY